MCLRDTRLSFYTLLTHLHFAERSINTIRTLFCAHSRVQTYWNAHNHAFLAFSNLFSEISPAYIFYTLSVYTRDAIGIVISLSG